MRKILGIALALFLLSPLVAFAASDATTCDYTDCVLLLHGDGSDASTTFTDSSDSAHTITVTGNAQVDTAQSKFGGSAIYFDGSSDNITFANDDDFKVNTGDFTIDFWVRWNGSVSSTIFSDMGDLLFALRWSNSATRWEPYMNGEPFGTSGTDSMSADTWYHIAWVRSGTTVYLFRNGTLIHSGSNNQNLAPTGTLYFGSRGNGSESMNGWIDEFRFTKGTAVWTSNFTPPTTEYTVTTPPTSTDTCYDTDTVLMLHMDGSDGSTTFTDDSGSAHSMTPAGGAQIDTAQNKFGGASALLDGTGDFISASDSADWDIGTGDVTVDGWFRWNSVGSQRLFTFGSNSGGSAKGLHMETSGSAFSVTFNTSVRVTANFTPSANTWYHIALVRRGTDVFIFVDGVQRGSTGSSSDNVTGSTEGLRIGAVPAGTESFNGWIDGFRFVKGTAVWTGNFTPPTSAYTDCNAGGDTFTPKITWFN